MAKRTSSGRTKIRNIGAFVVVALVTAGCRDRQPESAATENPKTGVAAGDVAPPAAAPTMPTITRVAAITGSPERFVGQTVTVEADVDEVLSPFAFELDEDSPVSGGIDNDLIVAWPKSLSLAPLDNRWLNNKVRVTGTVRRGSIVEIEKELDRDLSGEIEAEVKVKPILVATSVERIARP